MPNPYRGEITVPGLGVLIYNWDAVAQLVAALGSDFDAKITAAATATDIKTIALAVAVGTGKTVAEVMTASPPYVPTAMAVIAALNVAFNGVKGAPPVADANPPRSTASRLISSLRRALGRLRRV